MDLSTRKYINNTKPQLPKFNLGDEVGRVSGGLTPNLLFSKSLYDPINLPKTLPASTMKKVKDMGNKTASSTPKSGTADYVGAAVGALDTAMGIIKNSKPSITSELLLASAPVNNVTIDGIQTLQYGQIDSSLADVDVAGSAMSGLASGAATGAALGSVIPGVGNIAGGVVGGIIGGIGGLFGASSKEEELKKELKRAEERRNRKNNFLLESARTKALKMKEAEEIGDMESQSLFSAATGKEPDINPMTGMSYKNYSVNTAYGKQNMPQNAWVSKGEVIESADGSMYKVGFGKFAKGKEENSADTERAYIQQGDTIYSDAMINPDTGHTFAQDALLYREMNMLPRLRMNLKIARSGLQGYKCGLEKFAAGAEAYTNLIPTVAGLLGSYQQYKEASLPLYTPDVNTENAYANMMIPKLMSLKQDYYPIWKQNLETLAAARAATRASGGLSAGQKALAYANLYNNTQQNNAKAMFDAQLANNLLSQRAYEAALNVGAQDAARKQQGNIFNTEFLAKAHNAALQGRQMSLFNAINSLENYYANAFKKRQFDESMKLYKSDQDIKRDELLAIIDALKENKSNATFDNASIIQIDPTSGRITGTNSISPASLISDAAKKSIKNSAEIIDSIKNPNISTKKYTNPQTKNVTSKKRTLRVTSGKQILHSSNTPSDNVPSFIAMPAQRAFGYTEQPTISAIKEKFKDASPEARKNRPNKEKPGRPNATSNAEALARAFEYITLGAKKYQNRYGRSN